jgi:hypothetical protein
MYTCTKMLQSSIFASHYPSQSLSFLQKVALFHRCREKREKSASVVRILLCPNFTLS